MVFTAFVPIRTNFESSTKYSEFFIRKCCIVQKLDHLACNTTQPPSFKKILGNQLDGFIEGCCNYKITIIIKLLHMSNSVTLKYLIFSDENIMVFDG